MIYVCTVHFQTEMWIKRQMYYLRRNLDRDYRVLACVPDTRNRKDFYLESSYEPSSTGSQNHADKLNYLASIAIIDGKPDDVIIFLDGDAFPINKIGGYIEDKLNNYSLIAVQRLENDGDIQPHPSFTATTVGFWKEIKGDWGPGFEWSGKNGNSVTDTGGNLLEKLSHTRTVWYPMHRSNKNDLHPLWFGVYDDVIYHHGAGYRDPVSRIDLSTSNMNGHEFTNTSNYNRSVRLQKKIFRKMFFNTRFYREFI